MLMESALSIYMVSMDRANCIFLTVTGLYADIKGRVRNKNKFMWGFYIKNNL